MVIVVLAGVGWAFLRWVSQKLRFSEPVWNVIQVLLALVLLLAVAGLFGYGPVRF